MNVPGYLDLLLLVLPVFALIAVGIAVRRVGWVEPAAEASLVRLAINVFYPCLIFEAVALNPALRQAENLVWPPLLGFGVTWAGLLAGQLVARLAGLQVGTGRRTFALTVGIANYGFLPLPIMTAIWGPESRGVLLVHNVGVEVAIWTVGMLVLSGQSLREGWRRIFNPIVLTLVAALAGNLGGLAPLLPRVVLDAVRAIALCAVPLGLIITGVGLAAELASPAQLVDRRVTPAALALRLGALPLVVLALAVFPPWSVELKRVLVVQAAMPSAMVPVLIARLHGGHPRTAVQIVVATTLAGVLLIPLWLRAGLAWIGG